MPKLLPPTKVSYSPTLGNGARGGRKTGDSRAAYRLAQEIVALSVADNWSEAKREWGLVSVFITAPDECATCLCGHSPIRELCLIRNRENGAEAIVGNVCVTRFLGLPAGRIFRGLHCIAANPEAALAPAVVELLRAWGVITDRERQFLLDMAERKKRHRPLSDRQRAWLTDINHSLPARVAAAGRGVARA
jgi:hypothetical protein